MSTNFLLDKFLAEFPAGQITASQLNNFVGRALLDTGNVHNFDPVSGLAWTNHSVTVLYSGFTGDVYNGKIGFTAQNAAGNA